MMGMSLRDFGASVVVEVRSNCDQRAVEAVGGRDRGVLSIVLVPEAILADKANYFDKISKLYVGDR